MADVYTSGSGNWIAPHNGEVVIEGWGGGAGSGGGNSAGGGTAGSGGGGGGYFLKTLTVTAGQSIAYSVGAGGTGGSYGNPGSNGTAGGTTTVDGGTYTANGGAAGQTASTGTPAGGTASGGDINTTGGSGGGAVSTTGGTGGSSPNGGASIAGTLPNAGSAASGNAPGGGAPGGAGGVNGTAGGVGANGSASFDFTADPLITSEILRPIDGLEADAGNTTYQAIDDAINWPSSGGSDYVSYSGSSAGTVVEKFRVTTPTPGYTIIGAKLWILAGAALNSTMRITNIRMKLNGTWYDLGLQSDTLNDTPGWVSYELTDLNESSSSSDIGFEWSVTELFGTPGQSSQIDVAYMELTYQDLAPTGGGFFAWW